MLHFYTSAASASRATADAAASVIAARGDRKQPSGFQHAGRKMGDENKTTAPASGLSRHDEWDEGAQSVFESRPGTATLLEDLQDSPAAISRAGHIGSCTNLTYQHPSASWPCCRHFCRPGTGTLVWSQQQPAAGAEHISGPSKWGLRCQRALVCCSPSISVADTIDGGKFAIN
ncbi:hypothetical protein MGG_16503 [Pyricularia oryzae 70-15]|uniref:Uncharacterized protein n=1 Tax=Pyricularia oryzae (strain 70-15 / ATCC MYA-4617 / FGSC 8958) TaxID=242507 RepID=G4MQW7_PYRO7|nr:uncharacterized protein MGG_16503 [Pyricularia oryzae 70-15]EHA58198.1 hypothetical protein MGG_16503 [Pyricularia oryzae 70-15]